MSSRRMASVWERTESGNDYSQSPYVVVGDHYWGSRLSGRIPQEEEVDET